MVSTIDSETDANYPNWNKKKVRSRRSTKQDIDLLALPVISYIKTNDNNPKSYAMWAIPLKGPKKKSI